MSASLSPTPPANWASSQCSSFGLSMTGELAAATPLDLGPGFAPTGRPGLAIISAKLLEAEVGMVNRFSGRLRCARRRLGVERLESRRMLTAVHESQLFLYLLNEARHDPPAYQAAHSLSLDMSGIAPRQPLAVNAALSASSQFHSEEMATHNYFAHQSAVTGRHPNRNAADHGFPLPEWWSLDTNNIESIAAGNPTAAASLRQLTLSQGHRNHLYGVSEFFARNREAGIGYAFNQAADYRHYWTVHLAPSTPNQTFLTGVVFDDANDNGRYDLNEGLAGVTIDVGGHSVTTNEAGGWSIAMPDESTVTVRGSHPSWQSDAITEVAVGEENVQLDFRRVPGTDEVFAREAFGDWLRADPEDPDWRHLPPDWAETDQTMVTRVAYLIPSNRTPQPEAVANLQATMLLYQDWFREQMERNGFGPKTVQLETLDDEVAPRVHVVGLEGTDAFYRADDEGNAGSTIWSRVLSGATDAGVPVWREGEVWLLVYEAHEQQSDGSIVGHTALGTSAGTLGGAGGVGLMSSAVVSLMNEAGLSNRTPYDSLTIPVIGPSPLVQNVSFPWFEGSTISSVVSSAMGASLHELTHGFGLPHDHRNDSNLHGNLMGNGLRGFRGAVLPDQFPEDFTRLAYASALTLDSSPYFNAGREYSDRQRPSIGRVEVEPVVVDGHLRVSFEAEDDVALAAAYLQRGGDRIDELVLSGTTQAASFLTPDFDPGVENEFTIAVHDASGNRRYQSLVVTPEIGRNQAPRPFIRVSPSVVHAGAGMTLNASGSVDPDHDDSSLLVEWDLTGDGEFDTQPTTEKEWVTSFSKIGTRLIRARLTDPLGAQSVSAPIAIRVLGSELQNRMVHADVNGDGKVTALDALLIINRLARGDQGGSPIGIPVTLLLDEMPRLYLDVDGNGQVTALDALIVINQIARNRHEASSDKGEAVQAPIPRGWPWSEAIPEDSLTLLF